MTPGLALLHGFTGSPASFRAVTVALPQGAVVAAPLLVGHGAPSADGGVNGFEGEVDRLASLLRAGASAWHLAGYSLGGRLALGLLVRHPELFTGATLIGASPGLASEGERAERRATDERWCTLLEERGIEAFVADWEAQPLLAPGADLGEEARRGQRKERLANEPLGLARSLRLTGLGAMPSYWEALGRIAVPTTLMVGARDAKFTGIARRMADRLPGSTLEIVPGAGHSVLLERPDAVARVLGTALGARP
jgi:2-succinyl-6-hydroxy-2,4-cyclohexadiene-1-carboxylate synthase